jgi:hypothetical protein
MWSAEIARAFGIDVDRMDDDKLSASQLSSSGGSCLWGRGTADAMDAGSFADATLTGSWDLSGAFAFKRPARTAGSRRASIDFLSAAIITCESPLVRSLLMNARS